MNDDAANVKHKSWLERLSNALLGEPQDREALVTVLRDAAERQLLDYDSLGMIEGVLQVSEMRVRDIMIPRSQMVVIEKSQTLQQILPVVIASNHSRFPIIGDNRDEVIGILLAKDLLQFTNDENVAEFNIKEIMRPAVFVPESKRLDMMLKEFKAIHNHMAIVVDEYGGINGLVTIEDVLEQIVGEIEDEHDIDEDTFIKKYSEDIYSIKAVTPIEEFNIYFNTSFDEEEFDTIGGLVLKGFGHMPKRGEKINLGNYSFKIIRADNRRIHLLQASPVKKSPVNET